MYKSHYWTLLQVISESGIILCKAALKRFVWTETTEFLFYGLQGLATLQFSRLYSVSKVDKTKIMFEKVQMGLTSPWNKSK